MGSTRKALFLAPQFLTQTRCLTRTSTSSEHTALNKLKKTFILRQLVLNELHPPSQSRSGLQYSTAVFLHCRSRIHVCGNCSLYFTPPPDTVTQHLLKAHLMVMKFLLTMIKFHKAPEDNLRCAGAENETFGLVH